MRGRTGPTTAESTPGAPAAAATPAEAATPSGDAPRGRLGRRIPALASPPYRRFLGGVFVGNIGMWMAATAQGWLVLDLTGSPALLGVTSAASSMPTLLFSLWAGVLADRVDRRRLLIGTQLTGAAIAGILALLATTGLVTFPQIVVLAFLGGATSALATPAFGAIVPSLVDRSVIGSAVALNAAQFNLGRIIGPSIAGVAIAAGGLVLALWANVAALGLVAVVLMTLRVIDQAAIVRAESSMWRNLLDGLRYVRGQRTMLALLLLSAVPAVLVLNYLVLLPVYAKDVLGTGPAGLGMMTAAVGIGALAGATTIAIRRPAGGSGRLMLGGLAAMAGCAALFGASTWLPLSLAALAALGASQTTYYSTANTLIQVLVPSRLRGRVLSLWLLTAIGLMPLGNLLAGIVAERFSAPVALTGGSLLALALTGVVAVAFPTLRAIRPETVRRPATG
jgi:MFS family permease